ncbi:DUF6116 family protein [Cognatilysobacter bugurensis]|uniref:Uncharacterized protein n=1 Tax=Cognatilysobacter bugurensis TaxID=543356 RepID=A0A918W6T1_9GAMM|nr:DUF6116 family protein [Lysobacter bugurensis]GHA70667.1 hypothetical protein GCM10007067_03600 [Lysobacter bugurensis]
MRFLVLPLLSRVRRLRHPTLFKLTLIAFAISVLLPDPIPLVDEIVLGLATAWLASRKQAREPIDVTPDR